MTSSVNKPLRCVRLYKKATMRKNKGIKKDVFFSHSAPQLSWRMIAASIRNPAQISTAATFSTSFY